MAHKSKIPTYSYDDMSGVVTIPVYYRDEKGRFASRPMPNRYSDTPIPYYYAKGYTVDLNNMGEPPQSHTIINRPQGDDIRLDLRTSSMGIGPIIDTFLSPGVSKHIGDESIERISNSASVYSIYAEVDDIEEVARTFETHGYRVSISTGDNLFSYLKDTTKGHNRGLYEVIQCDDITISNIGSKEIEADIKNRFGNIMRFWHTDGSGNLICEQNNIKLGEIGVYDNTEV